METAEQPTKRSFNALSHPEKVRAILGTVFEPVSRDQVIEFSGLDYENLGEEERAEVDAVFTEDQVAKTEGEKYILKDEAKSDLEGAVDIHSVHGQISDVIINKIGIEF